MACGRVACGSPGAMLISRRLAGKFKRRLAGKSKRRLAVYLQSKRPFLMAVDKATVARIAKLARIRVPERDLDALAGARSNNQSWIR